MYRKIIVPGFLNTGAGFAGISEVCFVGGPIQYVGTHFPNATGALEIASPCLFSSTPAVGNQTESSLQTVLFRTWRLKKTCKLVVPSFFGGMAFLEVFGSPGACWFCRQADVPEGKPPKKTSKCLNSAEVPWASGLMLTPD